MKISQRFRIYTNPSVDVIFTNLLSLLDILEKVLQAAKDNVTDEPNPNPSTTTFRRRTTSPNAKPEKAEPDFTNEQVEIVKKVKK